MPIKSSVVMNSSVIFESVQPSAVIAGNLCKQFRKKVEEEKEYNNTSEIGVPRPRAAGMASCALFRPNEDLVMVSQNFWGASDDN